MEATMICKGCGRDDELRLGYCFDCATAGDLRLGRRTVLQHWWHAITKAKSWWMFKTDIRCGFERMFRRGDYAKGREWENL